MSSRPRKEAVAYAHAYGASEAARKYSVTRKTIYRWAEMLDHPLGKPKRPAAPAPSKEALLKSLSQTDVFRDDLKEVCAMGVARIRELITGSESLRDVAKAVEVLGKLHMDTEALHAELGGIADTEAEATQSWQVIEGGASGPSA